MKGEAGQENTLALLSDCKPLSLSDESEGKRQFLLCRFNTEESLCELIRVISRLRLSIPHSSPPFFFGQSLTNMPFPSCLSDDIV